MKNLTLALTLLMGLYACKPLTKQIIDQDTYRDLMSLDFLYTYQASRDTIDGRIRIQYPKLGLVQERDTSRLFSILKGGEPLFLGNDMKYQYLLEVFKDSFLVVTFVRGKSFAAVPDDIERDHVYILDLETNTVKEVSLKNILLTRSPEYLVKLAPYKAKADLKNQPIKRCAIEAINFADGKLILANQNLALTEYQMKDIDKPVRLY